MKKLFILILLSVPVSAFSSETRNSDIEAVFNENAAAIKDMPAGVPVKMVDVRKTVPESPAAEPKKSLDPLKSAIRGVQNILVPGGKNKPPVSIQELFTSILDLGYTGGRKVQFSWSASKEKSAIDVKCDVSDPENSGRASIMIWSVAKINKSYCIQPKTILGFIALRGADFDYKDSITLKYLCAGNCDSLNESDRSELRAGLPCFPMSRTKDGHYKILPPEAAGKK